MNRESEISPVVRRIALLIALFIIAAAVTWKWTSAAGVSVVLPDPAVDAPLAAKSGKQTAVVAGGCFWGVQAVFQHVKGVKQVTSGYSGGSIPSPEYEHFEKLAVGNLRRVEGNLHGLSVAGHSGSHLFVFG